MFYERFSGLCDEKKMRPTAVIQALELSTGNLRNWKNGRIPKTEVLDKIANFFGVSVDYLLGKTDVQTSEQSRPTDTDIKFALFGGDAEYISDEAFEDVRRFAAIVAEKERQKANGDIK